MRPSKLNVQPEWKLKPNEIAQQQTPRQRKQLKRLKDQMITNSTTMENKYLEGSTVFARTDPSHSLTVRRYAKCIYYCTDPANPQGKDKVYYERELKQNEIDSAKN
jgi:hypothetical protein